MLTYKEPLLDKIREVGFVSQAKKQQNGGDKAVSEGGDERIGEASKMQQSAYRENYLQNTAKANIDKEEYLKKVKGASGASRGQDLRDSSGIGEGIEVTMRRVAAHARYRRVVKAVFGHICAVDFTKGENDELLCETEVRVKDLVVWKVAKKVISKDKG